MDEKTKELFRSECKKDYKGQHYWKKIGVVSNIFGTVRVVWQCSQCDKCVSEKLGFLQIGEKQ